MHTVRPTVASPAQTTARPSTLPTARHLAIRVGIFAVLGVVLATAAVLVGTPPAMLPFVLAFGPTVIALAMAWQEGHGALRRLLRTTITRPPRRAWYAILAVPFVWALAVVGVALALGDPATGILEKAFPAILIVPLVVLIPAFAEEIAWRGYAVPRLLPSMSPLAAALLLAVPWIFPHLLLELPGQINDGLAAWPTVVSLASYSVILTWVFVRTGGSVLITALFHAGMNGVAPLMSQLDVDRAWVIRALLIAAVAVVIAIAGRLRERSTGPIPTLPGVAAR